MWTRLRALKYPFISIIIPTYNQAHCIEQSIRSILDQTYDNYELIIVDDGSTDDTEIVVRFIKDTRIHLLNLGTNFGASVAKKQELKWQKGSRSLFRIATMNGYQKNWRKRSKS